MSTHHGLHYRHVPWQWLQALQVVQVEAENNPVDLGRQVDLEDGGLHQVVVLREIQVMTLLLRGGGGSEAAGWGGCSSGRQVRCEGARKVQELQEEICMRRRGCDGLGVWQLWVVGVKMVDLEVASRGLRREELTVLVWSCTLDLEGLVVCWKELGEQSVNKWRFPNRGIPKHYYSSTFLH